MSAKRLSHVSAAILALIGLWFLHYGTRYYDAPVSGEGLGLMWVPILVFFFAFGLSLLGVAVYGWKRNRPDITTCLLVGVLVLVATFHFQLYQWSPNTQLVVAVGFLVSAMPAILAGGVIRYSVSHPRST